MARETDHPDEEECTMPKMWTDDGKPIPYPAGTRPTRSRLEGCTCDADAGVHRPSCPSSASA